MKCRVYLHCLIVGLSLFLIGGCSYSRASQVSRASETGQKMADELAEDDVPVKTASAEAAAEEGDGPPSQPGVKSSGGSRKKLTGWLGKGKTKSNTIPLDRTDKSRTADAEADAEEDSGPWKHFQDAPATAQSSRTSKTKDSDALSLSSTNPFEQ
ncbi:MAG: hypothetical protein JWN70_2123 [Planctomycetaceae bacterium]|nr:hypothetical protein [Planctomycetaceae bacterium]